MFIKIYYTSFKPEGCSYVVGRVQMWFSHAEPGGYVMLKNWSSLNLGVLVGQDTSFLHLMSIKEIVHQAVGHNFVEAILAQPTGQSLNPLVDSFTGSLRYRKALHHFWRGTLHLEIRIQEIRAKHHWICKKILPPVSIPGSSSSGLLDLRKEFRAVFRSEHGLEEWDVLTRVIPFQTREIWLNLLDHELWSDEDFFLFQFHTKTFTDELIVSFNQIAYELFLWVDGIER